MVRLFEYVTPDRWDSIEVRGDDDTKAFIDITVLNIAESSVIEIPRDQVQELIQKLQEWLR